MPLFSNSLAISNFGQVMKQNNHIHLTVIKYIKSNQFKWKIDHE